ncbi:MAG: alcohol dehydrogenase catalytic domain-containing protein, partial [Microbacterium sp.]|nr:alcohol dehydrogenase catalytic domain-containing protein [Microbacterium sp.]
MRAANYQGDRTISVVDREPSAPAPGQVRIRVGYVGICGTDLHVFHGDMDARVAIPATIGHEMSGVIDEIGPGVHGWAVG